MTAELNRFGKPMGKPGRPKKYTVKSGDVFGHLRVVMKVNSREGNCDNFRVECVCGKRETVRVSALTHKKFPKTHCGCKTYENKNPYPKTKICWQSMHLRCYYAKHVAYKDYGGRGIKICERWHRDNPQGFENFVQDVGPRPKDSDGKWMSIDRINPNGNYELHGPDGKLQVRWATAKMQRGNQRHNQPEVK